MPEINAEDVSRALIKRFNDPERRWNGEMKKDSLKREEWVQDIIDTFVKRTTIIITIAKKEDFIIGTVKGLSDKYGISYLLRAVAKVKEHGFIPIKLRIAGKGPQEQEYRQLAEELAIKDITTWLGFINPKEAAREWANMDVAVIPSTLESESFGVSAVEAQACGTAVIISDIPGLMEATKPGKTSIVVPRCDVSSLVQAIEMMFFYPKLRKQYADCGRKHVKQYEITQCFLRIEDKFMIYAKNNKKQRESIRKE